MNKNNIPNISKGQLKELFEETKNPHLEVQPFSFKGITGEIIANITKEVESKYRNQLNILVEQAYQKGLRDSSKKRFFKQP